ncbi:aromatic ring-opening dioxygenase [Citrobacter koseri]|nr:aromatic ring-opening dioxygenase [Citrobacter koseri]
MSSTRMPALFLGHGSPMNVLEDNVYTRAWRHLGIHCRVQKRLSLSRRTGSREGRA